MVFIKYKCFKTLRKHSRFGLIAYLIHIASLVHDQYRSIIFICSCFNIDKSFFSQGQNTFELLIETHKSKKHADIFSPEDYAFIDSCHKMFYKLSVEQDVEEIHQRILETCSLLNLPYSIIIKASRLHQRIYLTHLSNLSERVVHISVIIYILQTCHLSEPTLLFISTKFTISLTSLKRVLIKIQRIVDAVSYTHLTLPTILRV